MRIPGAGRLAALGLAIAASASFAQSPPPKYNAKPTAETSSWWRSWFGESKDAPKPTDVPPVGPTVTDKYAGLDRAMKAYLRRQEVCDRLRDIALQSNDEKLYEEASRLEEMAWRLHQTKSSRLLGTPAQVVTDDPPADEPKVEERTVELLKRATPGGQLPPRLQRGGAEPAAANRTERSREDDR